MVNSALARQGPTSLLPSFPQKKSFFQKEQFLCWAAFLRRWIHGFPVDGGGGEALVTALSDKAGVSLALMCSGSWAGSTS